MPWWLRAYLLIGAVQGLAIGLTGLFRPAHVVGFPLPTTPLNTRFVASFYMAGAAGLIASAIVRRAVDARIFLFGFVAVTALLLIATVWYWSTYTAGGIPYPWMVSYVLEPIAGVVILRALHLGRPAQPGRHRLSGMFVAQAVVFGVLGVILAATPSLAVRMWPWALTAVLARTYAAIFLAFALGAALAANESRRQAVRPFALSSLVLVATAAVASLVHHARFDGGPSTWIWAAGLAAGLAGFTVASRGVAAARRGAEMTPTLRPYLLIVGATLLGQGLVSWALDWSRPRVEPAAEPVRQLRPPTRLHPRRLGSGDARAGGRGMSDSGYVRLTLAFGVFYTALAVLGLVVHHPFGLRLDRGENVFHLLVGPITLALGVVAMRVERQTA